MHSSGSLIWSTKKKNFFTQKVSYTYPRNPLFETKKNFHARLKNRSPPKTTFIHKSSYTIHKTNSLNDKIFCACLKQPFTWPIQNIYYTYPKKIQFLKRNNFFLHSFERADHLSHLFGLPKKFLILIHQ